MPARNPLRREGRYCILPAGHLHDRACRHRFAEIREIRDRRPCWAGITSARTAHEPRADRRPSSADDLRMGAARSSVQQEPGTRISGKPRPRGRDADCPRSAKPPDRCSTERPDRPSRRCCEPLVRPPIRHLYVRNHCDTTHSDTQCNEVTQRANGPPAAVTAGQGPFSLVVAGVVSGFRTSRTGCLKTSRTP